MKKFVSVLLSFCMVLTAFASFTLFAPAATTYSNGDTFTVYIQYADQTEPTVLDTWTWSTEEGTYVSANADLSEVLGTEPILYSRNCSGSNSMSAYYCAVTGYADVSEMMNLYNIDSDSLTNIKLGSNGTLNLQNYVTGYGYQDRYTDYATYLACMSDTESPNPYTEGEYTEVPSLAYVFAAKSSKVANDVTMDTTSGDPIADYLQSVVDNGEMSNYNTIISGRDANGAYTGYYGWYGAGSDRSITFVVNENAPGGNTCQHTNTTGGVATSNGDGTHNVSAVVCSDCEATVTEAQTNVTCDTDGTDGACSVCGYKAASGGTQEIAGGGSITADGTYQITAGATGTITIDAGKTVKLIGQGSSSYFNGLSLSIGNNTQLTIEDFYANQGSTCPASVINFTGNGKLNISGTNQIDNDGGLDNAVIHVGPGYSLELGGDGCLYGYKSALCSYIGANANEANGAITIKSGHWFLKGTKTGAIIGGDSTSVKGGDITIEGGELYLKGVARGALIGGSSQGISGDVYVSGGLLELYEDFSGPAIGAGNNSNAGNLYVTGGSIKTVLSSNSYNSYGGAANYNGKVSVSWNAVKATNASDYALLPVDVSDISGNNVTVKVDGNNFYTGGKYTYVTNEVKNPGVGTSPSWGENLPATVQNWMPNNADYLVTEEDFGTSAYPDKCGSSLVPENHLYLALSKETHTILVNDVETTYNWDSDNGAFVEQQPEAGNDITTAKVFSSGTPTDGSVTTSKAKAEAGTEVTVTVDNPAGYYLAELKAGDTLIDIRHNGKYDGADGDFTFTMPDAAVTVTATFVKEIWDGTLDFSWYDETSYVKNAVGSYYMYYPAQWEALAWICSEDLYFLTEASADAAAVTAAGYTHAYQYNTNGNVPLVVGTIPTRTDLCTYSNSVDNSQYGNAGQNYFSGKTFYVMNDMDFGGTGTDTFKDTTLTTLTPTATAAAGLNDYYTYMGGHNYYPVGSQAKNDGVYVAINQSGGTSDHHFWGIFCGSVNGQGHLMDNIYCDRGDASNIGGGTGGTNYFQSTALIGRLGMPDSTNTTNYAANDCIVENIAVDGFIYGERSVGGIIGKTLNVSAGHKIYVKNCVNFATIWNTQSKGSGGIVGASWNDPQIYNCVNFGRSINGYTNACGGVTGSSEADIWNSYNVGMVSISSGTPASFGSQNSGAVVNNGYALIGSTFSGSGTSAKYSNTTTPYLSYNLTGVNAINSITEAADGTLLNGLNNGSRAWTTVGTSATAISSSASLKSTAFANALTSQLLFYGYDGTTKSTQTGVANLPIPRTFTNDSATVTGVTFTADPTKLSYIETQTFDTTGLVITANWSDGSTEQVSNYTVSKSTGLETTDTQITVSGTYGGVDYSKTYDITVAANELSSITASSAGSKLFAADETVDKTGFTVKATYTASTTAVTLGADDYTITEDRANNKVVVSYTYKGVTKTADVTGYTFLSSNAPTAVEGVYQLGTAEDMLWFANRVNTGNPSASAALTADINLSSETAYPSIGTSTNKYTGTFNGQEHTVTLPAAKYLFNYVNGGTVKNVKTAGTLTACTAICQYLSAGTIENCVNNAAITSSGSNVGAIVSQMTGGTVENCVNNGVINSTASSSSKVGGIVGNAKTSAAAITITGCANHGDVSASRSSGTTYGTGGVIGYAESSNSRALTITSCYNTGAVTGKYCLGGLFGYVKGVSAAYKVTAANCYNAGTVTETTATPNTTYTGAVMGYGANTYFSITDTYYLTGSNANAEGSSSKAGTFTVEAKTADELKALATTLGTAYKANDNADFNGGYPLLAYETIPEAAHTHSMEAHAATAATCTTAGNTAYWYCSACGKYFSDAAGTTEIEENSWVIAATGHTLTHHEANAATCAAAGNNEYWSCACGKYFSDAAGTTEIAADSWVIPATGAHTLTAHEAAAATCTTAGNTAYWYCSACGKYFSDAAGTTEIEENSWVIPATGHTLTHHEANAATCAAAGNNEYWSCACGKYFSDAAGTTEIAADSWVIAALGHSYGEWVLNGNVYTRTCTHEGCTDVETCKAGDANGDGKLTASDAGALLLAAASSYNFNETQTQAISQLAGSGYAEKAVTILQYLVGLKTSLFS